MAWIALLLVAAALALPPAAQAAASVSLTVRVSDGEGDSATARLTCRGSRASKRGYFRRDARSLCRLARRLAAFLDAPPSGRGQVCTQQYGGPDTARIRGRIGSRTIDRRFTLRDGCEIADWRRAERFFDGAPKSKEWAASSG